MSRVITAVRVLAILCILCVRVDPARACSVVCVVGEAPCVCTTSDCTCPSSPPYDPLDAIGPHLEAPHAVVRGLVRDVIMKDGNGCPMHYGVAVVAVLEVFSGPKVDYLYIKVDSDEVCWASMPVERKEYVFLLKDLPPGQAATADDVFDATPVVLDRVKKAQDKARSSLAAPHNNEMQLTKGQ